MTRVRFKFWRRFFRGFRRRRFLRRKGRRRLYRGFIRAVLYLRRLKETPVLFSRKVGRAGLSYLRLVKGRDSLVPLFKLHHPIVLLKSMCARAVGQLYKAKLALRLRIKAQFFRETKLAFMLKFIFFFFKKMSLTTYNYLFLNLYASDINTSVIAFFAR